MKKEFYNALANSDSTRVILNGCTESKVAEEVEEVIFLDDSLIAAKIENDIFVSVGSVCRGLGLTDDQKRRQVKNIQNDEVLNRGCAKFDTGVMDPNNSALGIHIDYLPIWLAKISITPKMKVEQPLVAEKLVQYQLKAKDALAKAFIHNTPATTEEILIYQLEEQQKIKNQLTQVNYKALSAVNTANEVKNILDRQMTINTTQQAQIKEAVSKRVYERLERCEEFDHSFDKKAHMSKFYKNIWSDLKHRFGVARYGDILHVDFEDALRFAQNWVEPADIR